jgi:hypothetical protein
MAPASRRTGGRVRCGRRSFKVMWPWLSAGATPSGPVGQAPNTGEVSATSEYDSGSLGTVEPGSRGTTEEPGRRTWAPWKSSVVGREMERRGKLSAWYLIPGAADFAEFGGEGFGRSVRNDSTARKGLHHRRRRSLHARPG